MGLFPGWKEKPQMQIAYGETLYRIMQRVLAGYVDWSHLSPASQLEWNEIGLQFACSFPMGLSGSYDALNHKDWKQIALRYGRHDPTCLVGAPCTCGFAEIERS